MATVKEQIILRMILAAADAGRECPSNPEMMVAIGAKSSSSPVNVMNALQERGVIAVERFSRTRIVTVIATGKSTAGDRTKAPHWRLAGAKTPGAYARTARDSRSANVPAPKDAIAHMIVDRDPCLRCGARGDYDCGHHAPRISMGAFDQARSLKPRVEA